MLQSVTVHAPDSNERGRHEEIYEYEFNGGGLLAADEGVRVALVEAIKEEAITEPGVYLCRTQFRDGSGHVFSRRVYRDEAPLRVG